jgi:GDP-L-fucose synthase
MKILITGGNGVVGSYLVKKLKDHDLYKPSSKFLDFADREHVDGFFNSHSKFDVVIHCAIRGGSRLKVDRWNVLDDNIKMYYNILHNRHKYNKLISFGSGAELDRRYDIDTSCDLSYAYPIDPYGMSKNFIAKSGLLYPNFNNIRIFGVFNHDELSTRMIKANILNYIHKQPIVIHKDRWMDFFFMDDLCKVVKFVIDSDCKQKTINCCYEEKYKLSKIASYINQLSNYEVDIIIENDNLGLSYFGDYNLHLFDVELSGIQNGIVKTYKKLLETK